MYSVIDDKDVRELIDKAVSSALVGEPLRIRQCKDEIVNHVLVACWNREKAYDPTRSKPVTYFNRRIRGAIQDWKRDSSPFKRRFHERNPDIKLLHFSGIEGKVCPTVDSDKQLSVIDSPSVQLASIKDTAEDAMAIVDINDLIETKFGHNPELIKIIEFRRSGYNNREIGKMLGYSEHSILLKLANIRQVLSESLLLNKKETRLQ